VAIIDGFAPFRWTGPNAQARWWADAERWGEQLGVASERISVEKTLHWQVVGTCAYAVLSATLTIGLIAMIRRQAITHKSKTLRSLRLSS